MATSERRFGNSEYVDAVSRPLRHWLVKWIVLFEVVLFVGGYLVAAQGPDPETLSAFSGVPFPIAAGVVMAALGIAFGLMLLVVYVGFVAVYLRSHTGGREF